MSYNPYAGVTSFNTRQGSVTLTYSDVTGALGFTPTTVSGAVAGVAAAVTGLLKSNGTALSAAVAGTDYLAPYGSQTANYVFAAPNGSAGAPTFRALAAADLPGPDPSTATIVRDDFVAGSVETGEVGELGWSFTTGTLAMTTNIQNHPGVIRYASTAAIGAIASFHIKSGPNDTICRWDEIDSARWIFREIAAGVADADMRFGLTDGINANPPSKGVYLEKLSTDTNWFFVCRAAGSQTRTDSGVAGATTGWMNIKLRRISATVWGFTLNGGSEVQITSNVPGAAFNLLPCAHLVPTTANARTVEIDYFALQLLAITR